MLRKARELAEAATRMCDDMKEKQRQQDERLRREASGARSPSFTPSSSSSSSSAARAANARVIPEEYDDRNDPILAKAKAMLHDYDPSKVVHMAPSLEEAQLQLSPSRRSPAGGKKHSKAKRGAKGMLIIEPCGSPGPEDDAASRQLLARARELVAGASAL